MRVEITDYSVDPHPHVYDGDPSEIEQLLREKFRSFAHGVRQGDLYTLAREIGRSSYIHIVFLDEQPQPLPHLHPKVRAYPEDPWVREADFSKHMLVPK
jgi:hypothetical protein